MNWNKKITYLLFKVFEKELKKGVKLSEIAKIIEPFQEQFGVENNIMQIWNYVDDLVANTIDNKVKNSIIAFRDEFINQVISQFGHEVNSATNDNAEKIFITHYITLLKEWRSPFINKYLEKTTSTKIDIVYYEEVTRFINHRRFVEVYPFLMKCIANDKINNSLKANLYAIAASIQLYYIGNKFETKFLINKGIELNPTVLNLKETQGNLYIENYEFAEAKELFEKMLTNNQEMAIGYNGLGNLIKKDYSKNVEDQILDAKNQYSKARIASPGALSSYQNENSLFCLNEKIYEKNKKNIEENYNILRKIERESEYDFTLDYGYNCQAANDLENAKKWFDKAQNIDNERVEAYLAIGHWYLLQVKTDSDNFINETEKSFTKAIELGNTCFDGYWGLNLLFQKQNKYDKAIEILKSGIELCPLFNNLCFREISNLYEKKGVDFINESSKYFLIAIENNLKDEGKFTNEPTYFENIGLDYEKLSTFEKNNELQNKYLKNAETAYKKAIDLDTETGKYLNRLGIFYYSSFNYDESIKYYKKAIAVEPDNNTFKNNLKLAEEAQLPEKEENELILSIKEEPSNHKLIAQLGLINFNNKNYDKAIEYYKLAIDIDIKNVDYYLKLSNCFSAKLEYTDALNTLNHAIEIEPNSPILINAKGLVYFIEANYETAHEYFEIAQKLDPSNWLYITNVGAALNGMDKKDDAIEALIKANNIKSDDYFNWNELGVLYLNTKKYDLAVDCFLKSIGLNSENSVLKGNLAIAFNEIGNAFFKEQNYKSALEYFLKATEFDNKNWLYFANIGTAYKLLYKYDEAIESYKKALEFNPKEYLTVSDLAALYINHDKQYELAIECLEKAISQGDPAIINSDFSYLFKNLSIAYNGIGVEYYAKYEDEKAAIFYKKAIDTYKDDPVYYKNLILVLKDLGRMEEALEIATNNSLNGEIKAEVNNYYQSLINR